MRMTITAVATMISIRVKAERRGLRDRFNFMAVLAHHGGVIGEDRFRIGKYR